MDDGVEGRGEPNAHAARAGLHPPFYRRTRTSMVLLLLAAAQMAAPVVQCRFDLATMQFAGTPVEQAQCLLRPLGRGGEPGPDQPLPATLARLVGTHADIDEGKLAAALRHARIPLPAATPVSETANHWRAAYFVIHDTSSPYIGKKAFPAHFSSNERFNDVRQFLGTNAVAHLFNDRRGRVSIGHDFEVGWRATKLESMIGEQVRGRFLHVENVQPRREDPLGEPGNDRIAPVPGLTKPQYKTLALLYVLASARAGSWLVPAFHANVDRGIPGAHDDPQDFDLDEFCRELSSWIERLRRS